MSNRLLRPRSNNNRFSNIIVTTIAPCNSHNNNNKTGVVHFRTTVTLTLTLTLRRRENGLVPTTTINQSINQSWVYIAHKRKASNALVR